MDNKTARQTWVFDSVTPPVTVSTFATLNNSVRIFGWVRDTNGVLLTSGVSAYLFDEDTTKPLLQRFIAANVTASNIRFDAYAATYTIIVAADGFAPAIGHHVRFTGSPNPFPLNGTYANNVTLRQTPQTTVKTAIQFPSGDWSTFRLTRSVVVSEGGPVEVLPYGYIRDAQLQMTLTFGGDHPNYNAGSTEANALQARLIAAGANNVTTATFISVDDKTYRNFTFSVAPVGVFPSNGTVTYGITANYVLTSGSIPFSATSNYYINTSLRQDRASRVVNYTYTILVPGGFDRSQVDAPGATVLGFAPIMIDPLAGPGYTRVNLVVKPSKSGDAYGRVIGPTDRIWEVNKDLLSYKAIVSYQVDIQVSAQDSTYPNAPDLKAFPDFNYTWIFDPANLAGSTRYGFKPTYKYSVAKEYLVNLTLTYPNSVKSMRTLTVDVDGVPPTIDIQVNGQSGSQTVNQNDRLRFTAINYMDFLWSTPAPMPSGVVRGYEWNFNTAAQPTKVDATSPTVDWTYNNPGTYVVTLRAIDGAGLKSANRTVAITVRDTTKPVIVLTVKQTDNQATVTTFVEGVNYTYDASATTDNVDPLSKLTFSWTFGDGAQTTGAIVTHVYAQYGDYKFILSVKDIFVNKS
jgi:PKD repeat protein